MATQKKKRHVTQVRITEAPILEHELGPIYFTVPSNGLKVGLGFLFAVVWKKSDTYAQLEFKSSTNLPDHVIAEKFVTALPIELQHYHRGGEALEYRDGPACKVRMKVKDDGTRVSIAVEPAVLRALQYTVKLFSRSLATFEPNKFTSALQLEEPYLAELAPRG